MKITIITSSRNGMPYLEDCLKSILLAAQGLDVEVLYEDACSTDGSPECARRLLGQAQVNIEPDEGFGDAMNRAFNKVTGDIIGMLPADDMLAPDSLRHVAEAFTRHPEAKWAIGCYEIIDQHGQPIRPFHTAYKNFAVRHFHRWWLQAENIIPFVSFFIRRDFRMEVGNLLNDTVSLANDYDYFLRCVKLTPPVIIPHVLGRWRYHKTSYSGKQMPKVSWDAWKACRRHTSNPIFLAANAGCSLRNALLYDKIG